MRPDNPVLGSCGFQQNGNNGFLTCNLLLYSLMFPQKVGALNGAQDIYVVSEPVRLYSDPGSTVSLQLLTFTTGQVSADLKVYGYLVNLP